METTKNRIKRLTSLLGVTQREIANAAHIRESSISNYVNGHCEPGQNTIKKIAKAFNVNPSWLMGYGEDTDLYARTADIFTMFDSDEVSDFDKALIAAYHDASVETQDIINTLLDLEKETDNENN